MIWRHIDAALVTALGIIALYLLSAIARTGRVWGVEPRPAVLGGELILAAAILIYGVIRWGQLLRGR